jgi:hypothetical protein
MDFVWPAREPSDALALILAPPIGVAVLAGHLALASSLAGSARWRASTLVVGAMLGVVAIAALEDDDDRGMSYPGTIKPLPPSLVQSSSLDQFFRATGSLQAQVDSLAAEGETADDDMGLEFEEEE